MDKTEQNVTTTKNTHKTKQINKNTTILPFYVVYSRLTSDVSTEQTESEGMEDDIPGKWKPKESRYISEKYTLKKDFKKQRSSLHNDKGSIQDENIMLVNIYAPNVDASKYIKQILICLKGERQQCNNSRGLYFSLTPVDRLSGLKINT